jgi:hypothetical protein
MTKKGLFLPVPVRETWRPSPDCDAMRLTVRQAKFLKKVIDAPSRILLHQRVHNKVKIRHGARGDGREKCNSVI